MPTNFDSRLKTIFGLLPLWDYGRATFGDAAKWNLGALSSLGSICSDIALVEMALSQCEKATSDGDATLLQLVALSFEAASNGLVVALREVRKQHGDDAWAFMEYKDDHNSCPQPNPGVAAAREAFLVGDVLDAIGTNTRPASCGSPHSLGTACLSWTAMVGSWVPLGLLSMRRHGSAVSKTAVTHARDSQDGALDEL